VFRPWAGEARGCSPQKKYANMHEKKLDKLLSGPQFFLAYAFAKNEKLSIIKLSPIDEQVFLDMFA
jgi:hypothetical protein